jgi:isoquinoline 1-oxidoreductase beta subunit
VVDVFAIPTGVAVVADNTFAARRGRDALRIEWDDREAETRSSAELARYYHAVTAVRTDVEPGEFQSTGDNPAASFSGEVAEFAFDFPFLAHAPMEPLDCVAQVKGWDVTLHSGAHLVTVDQIHAALAARTISGRWT